MKTLNQLYEEINSDYELKKEYMKAVGDKKVVDFLKAHDCEATESELESIIAAKKNKELDDDELDMVSGGDCSTYTSDGYPFVVPYNRSCKLYTWKGGDSDDSDCCKDCLYSEDRGSLICTHPDRRKK